MMLRPRRGLPILLLLLCCAANAADEAPPPAAAASAASAPAAPGSAPAASKWEGAIGPVVSVSPEYSGGSRRSVSVVPGFYIRYGRLSVSNANIFVTRRSDDVFHGLGIDLVQQERLRFNVALRIDRGRRSSDSASLNGIENVRQTIRARASATLQLGRGWKVASGWTVDLLGRGGGQVLDFGIGHDRRWSERVIWNIGAGLSAADGRYMRSYFGVTPSESIASGYPVYTPGAGLKDMSLGTSWRMEINPRWAASWGGSVGRVLGPAAASPLTLSSRQWSLFGGVGWRF